MKIQVFITPWAKQEKLDIQKDLLGQEVYKIRLQARPVEWEANEALIAFLAKHFSVIKKNIRILHGANTRHKIIEVMK